jgi:hypothetical protein
MKALLVGLSLHPWGTVGRDLFTNDVEEKWLMPINVLDDVIKNPPGKDATPPPKLNGWTN